MALVATMTVIGWSSRTPASLAGAEPLASAGDVVSEGVPAPSADGPELPSNDFCLICHSQPGLSVTLSDGEEQPLDAVDPEALSSSVHGELSCLSCHPTQSTLPHPKLTHMGKHLTIDTDSDVPLCSSCHEHEYEAYLDSVHGTVTKLEDDRAPNCIDCHTTHSVQPVQEWTKSDRAERCGQCHTGANTKFADGALGHRAPSRGWFTVTYFSGQFLIVLTAAVLAFGILHVEFDVLRWIVGKVQNGKKGSTKR